MSLTLAASVSISSAVRMIPSWSRNHCTRAPVIAIDPSRQYTGASEPILYPIVVSSPCFEGTGRFPVLSSRKLPVPYVFLAVPVS